MVIGIAGPASNFLFPILLFIGLYCLLTMRNLIKLFIGVVIGAKGVSLALIATGFVKNNLLLAQALAISFVVVEVCVVATTLALVINIYRQTGTFIPMCIASNGVSPNAVGGTNVTVRGVLSITPNSEAQRFSTGMAAIVTSALFSR